MSEDDFDLDDFNLDDFDPVSDNNNDIDNKIKDPGKSKKRQVVEDVFKGSIKGIKSYSEDKDKIRDFILNALPDEYSSIHEEVDKTAGDLRSLYDSAIIEIKPKLHNVVNKIDRLIPENQKFLKETLKSIKKKTETVNYQGYSQEDIQDKTIQTNIEDIFKTKEERDKKNKLLDDAVDTEKFKITDNRLISIDTNLAQLTSYTTNITQAYQKKSLELQYKSYFVQSELLKTTSDLAKVLTKQNEAIVKNTALPEFVKINKSEIFKSTLSQRAANTLTNSLFSNNNLASSLGSNLKNTFTQLKEGVLSGLSTAETIADASLIERDMAGMIGEKNSGAYNLGKTISTTASGFVADKLANKIKNKIPEDSKISEIGKDIYKYFKDPELLKEKIAKSDFVSNAEYGTIRDSLANTILDLFNSKNESNLTGKVNEEESLSGPGIFTNRTNKSITEVIPGYLSRILRELNIIRTGNTESPLVVYDVKSSKFITEKTVHSRLEKELQESINNYTTDNKVKELIKHVTKDKDLSDNDEAKRLMIKTIIESSSSSPERIVKTLKTINHPLATKLIQGIEKNILNSKNRALEESTLTNKFIAGKESLVNINKIIKDYLDSGYSDVLEKSGIIKINNTGSYVINKDKYIELATNGKLDEIINNEDTVDNTVNNSLNKIINNKQVTNNSIINTADDRTTNNESIFTNFNSDELNETLNKIYDTTYKSESILDKINNRLNEVLDVNIKGSVVINDNENVVNNGINNSSKGINIPDIFKYIYKAGNSAIDKIFNTGKSVLNSDFNPVKYLFNSLSNKDNIKKTQDIIKNILNGSVDLTDKAANIAIETGKNVTSGLFNLQGKTSQLVKKGFEKLTDYTGDIYIPGNTKPVLKSTLLKSGYYIDEQTKKIIQSVRDITGPVIDRDGNIVLSLEDFSKGLYDNTGKKIKIGYDKVKSFIKENIIKSIQITKDTFNFLKDSITRKGSSSLKESILSAFNTGYSDKVYDVLVEIRDILKSKLNIGDYFERPTNSQLPDEEPINEPIDNIQSKYRSNTSGNININSIKNKISDIRNKYKTSTPNKVTKILNRTKAKVSEKTDKILGSSRKSKLGSIFSSIRDKSNKTKSFIGGAVSSVFDLENTNETEIPKGPDEQQSTTEKIKKKIQKIKGGIKRKGIIDDDGDGVRDNSVLDRLRKEQEREEARKDKKSKADLTLRYRQGNVLDNILNKLSGFISKAGDILGSLAGLASVKGMKDVLGNVLNKGKDIVKGSKAKTKVKPGKGIKGLLTKGANITKTAGKFALGAGGTIARTALAVGGTALAGLGYTATGILSILSSPVILGSAALAAAGYGLYKAYNFITEDNYDNYEKIRLTQYGLMLTSLDKHHVHELLNLEKYLTEDKVGYNNGVAYLLSRKIDIKDMYSIFSIDEQDEEMTSRFLNWFENRFKPFFLTNLTALFSVNKKAELSELDDLTNNELSKYLSLISFDSGPYDYKTSPFIDLDALADTSNITKTYLNEVIATVNSKRISSSKPSELKSVMAKAKKTIDVNKSSLYTNKYVEDFNKEENKHKQTDKDRTKESVNKTSTKTFTGEEYSSKENTSVPADNKVNVPKTAPGPFATGDEGYSFIKKSKHINIEGLNPAMKKNFLAMAEEYGKLTGKSIHVNSAYRSTEEQKRLYRQNPNKAARPGRSLHEYGLAVDINTRDANELDKLGLMRKYGFTRPVGGETWHTEPAGIQGRIPEVKINEVLATELVEASKGRGGGGYATLRNARKNRRDNKYALSLLEAPVKLSSNSDTKPNTDIKINNEFTGMESKERKQENKVVDIKTKKPLTLANVQSFDKKPAIKPEVKEKPNLKVVKTNSIKQEDIQAAKDNGEKKPKKSLTVFNKPVKQLDSGQSLASTNIDNNVTIISKTLAETLEVHREALDVQKNMLELIKLVAENTDPDKLNEAKEVLSRPTNTSRNEQRTDLPINLKRRV